MTNREPHDLWIASAGGDRRPVVAPAPADRAGFTLIELLTVIAIIGVLASILIPVVGKVRGSARAASCTSNQRQIVGALHLHAADMRDFLPRAAYTAATEVRWTRDPDFVKYLPMVRRGEGNALWENFVFVCPMAVSPAGKTGADLRVTYAASAALIGGDNSSRLGLDKDRARKLGSIASPARTILVFDGHLNVSAAAPVGTNYSYTWSQMSTDIGKAPDAVGFVSYRHNNRLIAGMADGSVKTFGPADIAALDEPRWRGIQ